MVLIPWMRIIPALAGNTNATTHSSWCAGDHPRSRGEYRPAVLCDDARDGSSPLSRGIRRMGAVSHRNGRIIPALAGNTVFGQYKHDTDTDHPRSRGEYSPMRCCSPPRKGSSPLSRGIHPSGRRAASQTRIIPALAGNTVDGTDRQGIRRDHPRSRGEYKLRWLRLVRQGGSSPLSRGIPAVTAAQNPTFRIIPALAGNTSSQSARAATPSDHPRSRGEYLPVEDVGDSPEGSSPLSRGIRNV